MKYIKLFEDFVTFNSIYKTKNKWISLKDNNELDKIKDSLYVLVDNAYSKLGGNVSIKNPDDVLKRDYWMAVDIDIDPDADAVIFGRKTEFGIKISGIGHDGEKKSKSDLLDKLLKILKKNGYFIEASGKLKEFLDKKNINSISDIEKLKIIFSGSEIEPLNNNNEYIRDLENGQKTDVEKLFGNPK